MLASPAPFLRLFLSFGPRRATLQGVGSGMP